jgi:Sulfotransferase domain
MDESNSKLLVHLWCCPRTCSTATIYSFSRRDDCHVIDEPLYAHYLAQNPQLFRPYRDELLGKMENDGNVVMKGLDKTSEKRIIVVKHMTKFVAHLDKALYMTESTGTRKVKHIFLIRDPLDMILSWGLKTHVHQEECTLDTLSLPDMVQMHSELNNKGFNPIVVDSNLLRKYPKEILGELCIQLEIPYMAEQLSWPSGPKPDIDGYDIREKPNTSHNLIFLTFNSCIKVAE